MYDGVARFYDRYTADLNHEKMADFAEKCFARWGNKGLSEVKKLRKADCQSTADTVNGEDVENSTLVLDCACGTGLLTCIMAKRGYDMTGLDISQEMLYSAMERAGNEGLDNILWLCQDMCKIDMYGAFSAVLCMTDGINHLTTQKRLEGFLNRVYNFIDDGGLLIFDFLTENYFKNRVGNNVFFDDGEDGTCLWTSRYNAKSGICTYDITVYEAFGTDEDGEALIYTRSDDKITEKAWSLDEIKAALCGSRFKVCKAFSGMTSKEADDSSERIFIVAKKPKHR